MAYTNDEKNENEIINEEENSDEKNVINDNNITEQTNGTDKKYNIATAIIYPLILALIVSIIFFTESKTKETIDIIKYIICLVLYALSVFTILKTDVYVLMVPLPYITFYKFGSCKSQKPLWLRIIYGILSLVLIILPFLVILLF